MTKPIADARAPASARYEPDWISLAEARRRLMAKGLPQSEAETDIIQAYLDRKLRYRPFGKITNASGATVPPRLLELLELKHGKLRLVIPHHLTSADVDWEHSRPWKPWPCGVGPWRQFLAHIERLELLFKDVKAVFGLDAVQRAVDTAAPERTPGEVAADAIKQAFPDGDPGQGRLSHNQFVQLVRDCATKRGEQPPSKDTILRAAGRRKRG